MKKNNTSYMPMCQKIALSLIEAIRRGDYAPGDKLESVRELAKRYDVGRQVVLSAFTLLAKKNYLYTVHGSGTYINPQKQKGFYYRIGWFVNRHNPIRACKGILYAEPYLARHDFMLVTGSNFEEDFTFGDWFRKKNNLDGVIMTGILDDDVLKYPKLHHIPYVVFGNYDIAQEHPQVIYDLKDAYIKGLLPLLRQHSWKRFAVVGGTPDFRADREVMDAIRDAQIAAGIEFDNKRMLYAKSDGYEEINSLLNEEMPDAIFFVGEHWIGFQKYCHDHPELEKRPKIIVNSLIKDRIPPSFYDYTFEMPSDNAKEKVIQAVDLLLEQLEFVRNKKIKS